MEEAVLPVEQRPQQVRQDLHGWKQGYPGKCLCNLCPQDVSASYPLLSSLHCTCQPKFKSNAFVLITTYAMVGYTGKRSKAAAEVMKTVR